MVGLCEGGNELAGFLKAICKARSILRQSAARTAFLNGKCDAREPNRQHHARGIPTRAELVPRHGFLEPLTEKCDKDANAVNAAATFPDTSPGEQIKTKLSDPEIKQFRHTLFYTKLQLNSTAHLGQKAWVDITARLEKPTYYGRNDHDFKIKCKKQKTDVALAVPYHVKETLVSDFLVIKSEVEEASCLLDKQLLNTSAWKLWIHGKGQQGGGVKLTRKASETRLAAPGEEVASPIRPCLSIKRDKSHKCLGVLQLRSPTSKAAPDIGCKLYVGVSLLDAAAFASSSALSFPLIPLCPRTQVRHMCCEYFSSNSLASIANG
ncbi:hypothetical protein ANN_13665 [Periplaneta americana]|uniref:Uncharacterized protein n=1 Tax=Periplaneta americana TaxID=6978 RepID=A0ABQ8TL21_PERAM|nr:hypothetical protein ANN_13665 [Periplaneta americana]